MEVLVKRIAKKDKYTIGKVYIDGKYLCDSIEDKDRGLDQSMDITEIQKIKVKHQTAIPTGTYRLTINVQSPSFSKKTYYMNFCKGYVPRILNVPGFDGILLHKGNTQDDSSGCIILGYNKVVGKVIDSQKAFESFYNILKKTSEKIMITIK